MSDASNVVYGKFRSFGTKNGNATLQARTMDQVIKWAISMMDIDSQATKFELEIVYGNLRYITKSLERSLFSDAVHDCIEIDRWTVIGATD